MAERVKKSRKEIADAAKAREQREQSGILQAQQRRQLWDALADFISQQGGWLTSLPGKTLRIRGCARLSAARQINRAWLFPEALRHLDTNCAQRDNRNHWCAH